MKRVIAILVFSALIFSCNKKESSSKPPNIFYVKVDQLRLRDKPDLNSKVMRLLEKGSEVQFLGEKSTNVLSVKLQGIQQESPFFKIKTKNGLTGWVFGAALQQDKPLIEEKKNPLVSEIDASVQKLEDMIKGSYPGNLKSSGQSAIIQGFEETREDKGPLLISYDEGYTEVGNPTGTYYYKNGVYLRYVDDSFSGYYVNAFPALKNGVHAGISQKEALDLLSASPAFQNEELLIYYNSGDMEVNMEQMVFLLFRQDKLIGIKMSYIMGD